MFLLKGHEDLRQDERVMQLFGLVNTLLLNDPKTFRHNLTIQVCRPLTVICLTSLRMISQLWNGNDIFSFIFLKRYTVIPLSTNSGLIGWVPHCDTLHTLIRDYREKKKILLNIEHRIMLRVSNIEVFVYTCLKFSEVLPLCENTLSNYTKMNTVQIHLKT